MTVVATRSARSTCARILRAPFTSRAWAQLGYTFVNAPLAIAGFAFTVLTLAFSLHPLGLLVLGASAFGARGLASVSRGLARRFLGERVPAPPPLRPAPGLVGWLRSTLGDAPVWRARGYLLLKLPVAVLGLFVSAYFWLGGLVYVTFPVWWEIFHRIPITVDGVSRPDPVTAPQGFVHGLHVLTLGGSFLLVPIGAAALLAAPWMTGAVVGLDRSLIRRMLGPTSLAERVRDLELTRAHAVDDSAARLRSIERDLHDGAQAQLVGLAMKLGLAKEKLGGGTVGAGPADLDRAAELVDAAHRSAMEAITELRVLARGIHPPVLDNGLADALATLAARSTVPVELVTDIRSRPSAAIETIAYFCAAELLTNVAKHSGARHATLEAVHVPGMLRLRVSDDGSGDAHPDAGGGLSGLADRIRTVDGRMEISSPRGGPTVVTVELPSEA